MALKVDETIDQNIAKLSKIDNKLMQLTAPVSDCEIEAQIGGTDERQRTTTVLVRDAILKYDQTEHMFQEQLTRLWSSWIGSQLKIQKLQNDLQELCQHELSNGSNGISASNREWADHEDRDVGRRSKKVVEDMELCEEVSSPPSLESSLSGSLRS
ncbi:hypothetical protein GGS20DRAFT_549764 [Poronia punctata]|nr:hypothetical protein GGS20DRAFT_549764 [Poronia punctata]